MGADVEVFQAKHKFKHERIRIQEKLEIKAEALILLL